MVRILILHVNMRTNVFGEIELWCRIEFAYGRITKDIYSGNSFLVVLNVCMSYLEVKYFIEALVPHSYLVFHWTTM